MVTSVQSSAQYTGSLDSYVRNKRPLENGQEGCLKKQKPLSTLSYDIKASFSLTDAIFSKAIDDLSPLQKVVVSHGYNQLTDKSLGELEKEGGNLSHLELHSIAQAAASVLGKLVSKAANLQVLDLSECPQIGQTFVQEWKSPLSALAVLKLRYCENITDEVAESIFSNCPNLKELDLEGCEQCTDKAVLLLAAKTNGITDSLQKLSLGGWPHLSFKGLLNASLFMPNLVEINLNDCYQLKDADFASLQANSFSKVTKINLSATSISDKTIEKLATMDLASNLEVLVLNGCEQLSGKFLEHLSKFPNLKVLEIAFVTLSEVPPSLSPLKNCEKLEVLNLNHVKQGSVTFFDPQRVVPIINQMPQLKELHVEQLGTRQDFEGITSKILELRGV